MGGAPNIGYAGEVADDYASDKACAPAELFEFMGAAGRAVGAWRCTGWQQWASQADREMRDT